MFSHHRLTTLAATAIGATAIGLAALAAPGTAAASTVDDDFLSQVSSLGISFPSPQAAIQAGHQVCRELARGETGVDIGKVILSQTDLTPHQAAYFIADATNSYCPQYADQVNA